MMKTIGLIGGMSWESSKVYYEYVNRMVSERLGGSHSAKILMSSVDFAEIEKYSFEGNWDKIGDLMQKEAKKLENAGADAIVVCTNTIHLVSEQIVQNLNIPFLHIAGATGKVISKKKLKKVGLLGTKFTMEKDFYTKILEQEFDLEVLIPSEPERENLQDIIYNQLVRGIFTDEAKQICLKIIENLKLKGVDGIILGCTELPILISETDVDIPTFNTTLIHSQMAADFALNEML